jgi:small membrane protein
MTFVFQIAIVVVIVLLALVVFRGQGDRHLAVRRIFLLLFIVAAASSVFFPQIWTYAANLLGIGRGTDLIVYLLVLFFLGFVATTYRRFRQMEINMTEIARKVALQGEHPPEPKTPISDDER